MRGHVLLTLRLQLRGQHSHGVSELFNVLRLTLLLAGVWESDAVEVGEYGNVCLDM